MLSTSFVQKLTRIARDLSFFPSGLRANIKSGVPLKHFHSVVNANMNDTKMKLIALIEASCTFLTKD